MRGMPLEGKGQMSQPNPETLDLLWGAAAIGAFLNLNRRQSYHCLENDQLPARKVGDKWVASRDALRRHILGEEAA